jgi:Ca2+-binding EF-hand superfamily protein
MLHECLANALRNAMAEVGLSWSNRIRFSNVIVVLDEFGSVSSDLPKVIHESVQDLHLEHGSHMRIGDFYALVVAFCERDGFTHEEQEHLQWLWEKFGSLPDVVRKQNGNLSTCEVGRVLRWLGYATTQYRTFDFAEKYDRSQDYSVDCQGFFRLIADWRSVNLLAVREHFRVNGKREGNGPPLHNTSELDIGTWDSDSEDTTPEELDCMHNHWVTVVAEHLESLLCRVGHQSMKEEMEQLARIDQVHEEITWRDFLRLEDTYRRKIVTPTLKAHLGWSAKEYESLMHDFRETAKTIKNEVFIFFDGLAKIVQSRFNRFNTIDKDMRSLVQASDLDGDGRIGETEYLWVMRRIQDKSDKQLLTMANDFRETLGFGKDELVQFRELFNEIDIDKIGSISFMQFQKIIELIISLCLESRYELKVMYDEQDKDSDGFIDFWDFLQLMQVLQQKNWRNINGVASGIGKIGRVTPYQ